MPPDSRRGGATTSKRRLLSVAHHHTATDTTTTAMVRHGGGDVQVDPARRAYAVATEAAQQAIAQRIRAACDLLDDHESAVVLELLRATLHAEVDHLIDREARRRATACRMAAHLGGRERT